MAFSYGHRYTTEYEQYGSLNSFTSGRIYEYTPPGAYSIDAQPAAFVISAFDADLVHTTLNAYFIDAQPASYTFEAFAAGFASQGGLWTKYAVQSNTWVEHSPGGDGLWVDY